jgi:signal transduction histidine kinase/ActR/RegA family two-component response regulator
MTPAHLLAAEHLIACKAALLARWRDLVRADSRLPDSRLYFSDEELEDHLPALLDSIASALRGDEVPEHTIREPAMHHGSTRRAQGYSITQVIWEFSIFRQLLREAVEELSHKLPSEALFQIREAVLSLTDLSEIGSVEQYIDEAQRERDAAREELRKANEQKDQFLAVLSHELRNPLASIRTAAHILRSDRFSAAQRQKALDVIEQQTKFQTRLIDDLLDMNRISQGRIQLKRESIDLRRSIQNVIETYWPAMESKSISFRFDSPDREVMSFADPVRIEQVVSNLLTNSLKFTSSGGSIEIRLQQIEDKAIISVSDSGAGIEPSKLDVVFELYSQARTARNNEEGLGIGLWLAKQLVEMHGGTIKAVSEGPEKGTEVVVQLDCIQSENPESAAPQKSTKRVLLVEDDPDQRELLAATLREPTVDVVVAKDGSEAVAIVAREAFDVCILDLNLPDISGHELAGRMLKLHRLRKPKMIALTGYSRPEDAARIKASGFHHHLVKPADIQELQRLISQADLSLKD